MTKRDFLLEFLKFHYKQNQFRKQETNEKDVDDFLTEFSAEFEDKNISSNLVVGSSYLLLSGEGDMDTEHLFCMELSTIKEANYYFDDFKRGQFKNTYLFIYEAKKIREG